MDSVGIYIHIPFCARKCPYCDFNAYSEMGGITDQYVETLCKEIEQSPCRGMSATTIFFGGGTPTFLTGEQLGKILSTVRNSFTVSEDAEVSSEANPTTVDASKFGTMRRAGFNRISIGVQSFDDGLLRTLGREHSGVEAIESFRAARSAGFDNVSIDLMFGLPAQSLDEWKRTLSTAIELNPEHVSTYSLTIEPGTRFERLHAGGKLPLPAEDIEIAMYELAIEWLGAAGIQHYEVSNFAKSGRQSRHNLIYWANGEYLGFGAGAVSYFNGTRWTNEKHPAQYIRSIKEGRELVVESETLDTTSAMAETLIQGLRLRQGIALVDISSRFHTDCGQIYGHTFRSLELRGLVEIEFDRVRLSHRGLLLANDVFLELLPD